MGRLLNVATVVLGLYLGWRHFFGAPPAPPPTVAGLHADIEIYTKEMLKTREQLNAILAHHTGQPLERIERDTDRNFFMSAEEARDYGIVDHVINRRLEISPTPVPQPVAR